MLRKRWTDLDQRSQRLLLLGGVVEAILKTAALVDLVRRPAAEVRGPKPIWIAAVVVINSVGAVPIAYFAYGRRKA